MLSGCCLLVLSAVALGNGFLLSEDDEWQVWLTTGDQVSLLERQAPVPPTDTPHGTNVWVNRTATRQTIDGYGASITNAAAYVIYNSNQRHAIMQDLFGNSTDDLGVSYIRVCIGASDMMVVSPYTYDDLNDTDDTDFDMEHFSIEKDRDLIIPILKEALSINPTLKIMASPWSAPAWMKTSKHLFGGEFIDDPRYMQAFAKYFVMFIQAYEEEGIPIHSFSIQNEPLLERDYPTMIMNASAMTVFIKEHLGPLLVNNSLTTKLLIWDFNWVDAWYPEAILNDDEARQYISGVTWHGYEGAYDTPKYFQQKYPDIGMYFSEFSGGDWDDGVWANRLMYDAGFMYIGQSLSYSKNVILWNMALDENRGPKSPDVGGCAWCRPIITVPANTSYYTREVDYYALGHLSRFVKTGATRIESFSQFAVGYNSTIIDAYVANGTVSVETDFRFADGDLQTAAFVNVDGSTVVVVHNPHSDRNVSFYINIDDTFYQYPYLPPQSIATFIK